MSGRLVCLLCGTFDGLHEGDCSGRTYTKAELVAAVAAEKERIVAALREEAKYSPAHVFRVAADFVEASPLPHTKEGV